MFSKPVCAWLLVALAALLSPPASADEDYVPSEALRETGLIKSWQLHVQLEEDQRLADVHLVDDQLYLCTNDGYVFAVHADTGANRWLRRVTDEGYRVRRPCHAGQRVIFVTPTTVLQLDRCYGDGIARRELPFPAGSGPATDGVRLYVGGLDQRIYAFELHNFLRGWKVITNGPLTPTPVMYEGNLFAASDDGTVYSCTGKNKAFRWQTTVFGSVTADLAISADGVYVAARDRSLYLLDLLFGEIRWKARFSGPLYEAPVVTPGVVYQYCPDDGLVALHTAVVEVDKRQRWKLPRGRRLLTIDDRYAYVLTRDETVLAVEIESGEAAHTLPAPGMTLGAPSTERTALYVASPDGRVLCARPRGTPPVTRQAVRDAISPPPAEQEKAAAEAPAAKPAPEKKPTDPLRSGRRGVPIGGKSEVSKNFGKGGGSKP